jgi:hypothetical protein
MDGIFAALILVVVLIAQSWLGRLVAAHRPAWPSRLRLARDDRLGNEPVPAGSTDARNGATPAHDRTPAGSDRPS